MKLAHIPLKLQRELGLIHEAEYMMLKKDVEEFESKCTLDSKNKFHSLYAKAHQGILFELVAPFIYVYLMSWVKDVLSNKEEDKIFQD